MKVACVCYATEQGLGHLAKSFYDAGVVTDPIIFRHSHYETHYDWYPPGTPVLVNRPFAGPDVDKMLAGIDVVLFFETPWDWDFPAYCKRRGVRTAMVPMYEWWPVSKPASTFDKIIAPSLLDRDYFPGSVFVPIPVRTDLWKLRTRCERFLHNGGHLGHRGHKGTLELIKAIPFIKSPLHLTIRAQDTAELQGKVDQAGLKLIEVSQWYWGERHADGSHYEERGYVLKDKPDLRLMIGKGTLPWSDLWGDDPNNHNKFFDAVVVPEKFNGISLPLAEARAAGLAVITTDRYPMNTWLPKEPLIPVKEYHKARVGGSYNEFDEATVEPEAIAAKMDEWFGRDITQMSLDGLAWAEDNSWEKLRGRWLEALS